MWDSADNRLDYIDQIVMRCSAVNQPVESFRMPASGIVKTHHSYSAHPLREARTCKVIAAHANSPKALPFLISLARVTTKASLLILLTALAFLTRANEACETVTINQNDSIVACSSSSALLNGQTFYNEDKGWLTKLEILACNASPFQFAVHEYNEANGEFDAGLLLFTSQVINPSNLSGDCTTQYDSLESSYHLINYDLSDQLIALKDTQEYILILTQGYAASSCAEPYSEGTAFAYGFPLPHEDVGFQIETCPDSTIVFGCLNPLSCNYDPEADGESGHCLTLDCNQDCGGEALFIDGCGCVGGNAEILADQCFGCTDTSACNYSSEVSSSGILLPAIDDGSCLEYDCNNDCGGAAYSSSCGCIGGNTGLNGTCINGCITSGYGKDRTSCPPLILSGTELIIPETGFLSRVGIACCCAYAPSFNIRRVSSEFQCSPETEWNQGEIVYSSAALPPTCTDPIGCFISSSNYEMRYWTLSNFPVIAGDQYIIELKTGYGTNSCQPASITPQSFGPNGLVNGNLHCELDICSESNDLFGCTDSTASNYVPTAQFDALDCIYVDCQGTAQGGYTYEEGCGCYNGADDLSFISCLNGHKTTIIENNFQPCSQLVNGQSWTSPANGHLVATQLKADTTLSFEVKLFTNSGPFKDSLLATTTRVGSPPPNSCTTQNTHWITLGWDSIPLKEGVSYRIESTQQVFSSTCTNGYDAGDAILGTDNLINDAIFRISFIEDSASNMLWGCRDFSACNYQTIFTHDDGECAYVDCANNCPTDPGYIESYFVEGCGCVGATGLQEEQCFGCTETDACNYDPIAQINDGSCNPPDCNGDCLESDSTQTGLATDDPVCGCIGGNTVDESGNPLDFAACNPRCQGLLLTSTYEASDNWGTYLGLNGIQSFQTNYTGYLTGIKLLQLAEPSNINTAPFTIEIRTGSGSNLASYTSNEPLDTVEAKSYSTIPKFPNSTTFELYFEINNVIPIADGEFVFIRLLNGNWQSPTTAINSLPFGQTFFSPSSTPSSQDLFLEAYACDNLAGCTDPTACNFDSWATTSAPEVCYAHCNDPNALNYDANADPACTNNDYCEFVLGCTEIGSCNYHPDAYQTHPYTGESRTCVWADSTACLFCPTDTALDVSDIMQEHLVHLDNDGDNVCDPNEITGCRDASACNFHALATDDGPCIYSSPFCSSCSGEQDGTGTVIVDGDTDSDGICDILDLCSDSLAFNYITVPSAPCEYDCNQLPAQLIFEGVTLLHAASSPQSNDASLLLNWSGGQGGDSLQWSVIIDDITDLSSPQIYPLTDTITGISPSVYRIQIRDGWSCAGRTHHPGTMNVSVTPPFPIHPTTGNTTIPVGIPFNNCEEP